MLRFENLSLRRGSKLLFRDACFQIHPGQHVGVTGANGCGKSSLFALILDQLHADGGEFHRPQDWVIAHVAQETPNDTRPALEFVMDGDSELRQVQQQLAKAEQADDGARVAELHGRLDAIDGYSARARAATLIHGLGFAAGEELHPVESFSGGWRMRLNLARALMCRSDLLLLDEPTNHLDLDAVLWLEQWLQRYPGTLLLISHDRDFLDTVCNQIAHIEQGQCRLYSGNYSAFERIRAEHLANQQAAYQKQQREISHIRSYVERFRAKATKARQAQSRLKALERMQLIAPAHIDSPFHFRFREPEKHPNPLLKLEGVTAGYSPDKPVLKGIRLTLSPGARIGLLGPNGAGKSTLIKLLAGELACLEGERNTAQELKIGYFAQHQLEQLRPDQSPLQHLQHLDRNASEQSLRDFIGGFGFSGERAETPTLPFSGGEKARLALALLVYQRPNLLLLDEPTNHLDLEMRLALTLALQEYPGAMLVVSHDRHLLRSTCDELWIAHNGALQPFVGELDDYPAWLSAQQATSEPAKEPTDNANSAQARRERKRREAERRSKLQPLRRRLDKAEQTLEKLQSRQQELEQSLGEPELYQEENKARLRDLLQQKGALDRELQSAEAEWMQAMEQLESAEADTP